MLNKFKTQNKIKNKDQSVCFGLSLGQLNSIGRSRCATSKTIGLILHVKLSSI
jgi:hypothetical protein